MRERHNFSFAMMQPLVIIVGACVEPCAMDIVARVLAMHMLRLAGLCMCDCLRLCLCARLLCVCVRGWCVVEPDVLARWRDDIGQCVML